MAQLQLDLPLPGPITPLPEVFEVFEADWRVMYRIGGGRSSRVISAASGYAARQELLRRFPGAEVTDVRLEP